MRTREAQRTCASPHHGAGGQREGDFSQATHRGGRLGAKEGTVFRAFRTRVWGVAALLSSALALAGAGPLTAPLPPAVTARADAQARPSGSSTEERAQARSKLLQARAFLGQGNFEQAEALAAEVAALKLSYVASEDSPAKLTADLNKAKGDPKALLQAARAALARKDYDRAEKYAR